MLPSWVEVGILHRQVIEQKLEEAPNDDLNVANIDGTRVASTKGTRTVVSVC